MRRDNCAARVAARKGLRRKPLATARSACFVVGDAGAACMTAALRRVHDGGVAADVTVAALTETLAALAGQRANVMGAAMPELDLFKG